MDDAQWAKLRRHFSEAEVIELVAHTTLYIGFGRFNEIVGIEAIYMEGPDMAPHTPQRSGRPGKAVATLVNPGGS